MRLLRLPVRRERVAWPGARHDSMNEEALRRLDLLGFRERDGTSAAVERGGVSVRALYRCGPAYNQAETEGLVPGSPMAAPDPEAGVAGGRARRDPAAPGGPPQHGLAEYPPAPPAVLRGAGPALPGASDHRAADRRRRGSAGDPAAAGQPGGG